MTTKHEKRPAPVVGEHTDSSFSDADISEITEGDLRERSQALHDAQESWEQYAYMATKKVPCRECGGRGQVAAGSFGDIECPNCHGKRVVESPGNDDLHAPPFAQMRLAITAYGEALADRALPPGPDGAAHKGKRNLALPAASSVPTIDAITAIQNQAKAATRSLEAAGAGNTKQLGETTTRPEDEQGEFTDEDLDKAAEGDHDE